MQIFVMPSDLWDLDATVNVIGAFDDGVTLADDWAPGSIRLSIPGEFLEISDVGMRLRPGWREPNKRQILNGEATRRIDDVFSEYSQLNSNAEMNELIRQYGADMTRWPRAASDRAAEIDRCWAYVNAVRNNIARMMPSALPADPTADAHWPPRTTPFTPR